MDEWKEIKERIGVRGKLFAKKDKPKEIKTQIFNERKEKK